MRTPKSSTIVSRAVSRDIPAEMSDARRAALERMRAARLEPRKNVAIQNCTNWSHTKTGEGDTSCAEQYVVPDQQTRYFKFQSLKTTRHALFFFSLFDFKLPGPRLLSFHFLVFPGGQENHWKGRVLWGSWFGALDWQLMTQRRGVICLEFECFSHGSTVFDCIYLYSNWGETGWN